MKRNVETAEAHSIGINCQLWRCQRARVCIVCVVFLLVRFGRWTDEALALATAITHVQIVNRSVEVKHASRLV